MLLQGREVSLQTCPQVSQEWSGKHVNTLHRCTRPWTLASRRACANWPTLCLEQSPTVEKTKLQSIHLSLSFLFFIGLYEWEVKSVGRCPQRKILTLQLFRPRVCKFFCTWIEKDFPHSPLRVTQGFSTKQRLVLCLFVLFSKGLWCGGGGGQVIREVCMVWGS